MKIYDFWKVTLDQDADKMRKFLMKTLILTCMIQMNI